MTEKRVRVLVAHADGEEGVAAKLSAPLREAGYDIVDHGSILVGESLVEEASRLLAEGWPVIVCGTAMALGTGWAHRVVSAARQHPANCILPVRMEQHAYLEMLSWDLKPAEYWQDPGRAVGELRAALEKRYPTGAPQGAAAQNAEARYRSVLLKECDLLDLSGLPERDRHLATRQLELRRLYVALRVQREEGRGSDDSLDPDPFGVLEQDRAERRGAYTGNVGHPPPGHERASLGELLAVARRLVVLGDPGAGKSTLLRWLTTAYLLRLKHDPDWAELPDVRTLPDEDWLPILVRCRDLGHEQPNGIDELLEASLRTLVLAQEERASIIKVLLDRLRDGTSLLLVDGLDEINDLQTRAAFRAQIERLHNAFPDAPVIVTSRIVGYREMRVRIGRGFEHVTIADLSPSAKDEFAQRWCELTEPPSKRDAAAAALIRDIHSFNRIERLTDNPLLLTTMALVRRSLGRLPNRRVDLYEESVRVLVNWRPEVGERLELAEALPQLEYVAYAMCQRQVQQLRFDELADLCTDMREAYPHIRAIHRHAPEDFIRLVEQHSGLLVEVGELRHQGQLVPVYEFRHLTFQEYLAGTALVHEHYPGHRRNRPLAAAVAPLAVPTQNAAGLEGTKPRMVVAETWCEPLRLCVATCSPSEVDDLVACILQPSADENAALTTRPRVVLAAQCLADEPNVSDHIAEQVTSILVEQLWKGVDHRPEIANAATELARSCWRKLLLDRLVIQFLELPSLNRANPPFEIYAIIELATAQPDGRRQRLTELPEKQLPALTDADPTVTVRAILTVAARVNPLIFEANDPPSNIVDTLIQILDSSEPITEAATLALWRLFGGSRLDLRGLNGRGDGAKQPSPAQHRLLAEVLSAKPMLSDGACLNLYQLSGRIGAEFVIPLARTTLDSPHSELRAQSAWTLGSLGDLPSLPSLMAMLGDPSPTVRAVAARAIGWCGDRNSFGALVSVLEDQVTEVRVAACTAIGQLRHSDASVLLTKLLADGHPRVRAAGAHALGELRDRAAAGPVATLLEDPAPRVRAAVASSLGNLGSAEHIPLLLALLDDEKIVQDAAAEAICKLADQRHLQDLLSLLQNEDYLVTHSVAGALRRIGNSTVVPALLKCLENKHVDHTAIVEALTSLTSPENPEVRDAILRAVATEGPAAIGAAAGWLKDANQEFLTEIVAAVQQYDSQHDDRPSLKFIELVAAGMACHPAVLSAARGYVEENEDHIGATVVRCAAGLAGSTALLLRLMSRLSAWHRQQIADALAALEDPTQEAISVLVALASDDHPTIRTTAARSLCRLDRSDATAAILPLLDDPVPWVRQDAVSSLQGSPTVQSTTVTNALLERLGDRYFPVRMEVVRVLGEAPASVATPPLLDTLANDISGEVRRLVPEALAKHGIDEAGAAALRRAANDDTDSLVREAARKVLEQQDQG